MKYIFCDSDNGGTPTNATPDTSTSKYHTTSTWPANGARWASIATALADTTITALADDLTIYAQGVADFLAYTPTALSALSVTLIGNATGAKWEDTKAKIKNNGVTAPINHTLTIPITIKNIQLYTTQSTGTPRLVYANGSGAVTLDSLKMKSLATSTTGTRAINGSSAIPVSVTATNCIVDMSGATIASDAINLQTATVGKFYNCIFRGTGNTALNPDTIANCVFIDFTSFTGSSGSNYKYCYTPFGLGTAPVTVSSFNDAFIDFRNFDYRLKTGSALIGVGIGPSSDASVPTTDIAGNTRSGTTTDVGAAMYTQILTITSVDGDDTVYNNQVVNIVGTGFGTVQGLVFIDGVQQSINSWSDTLININVQQGALSLGANTLKVFKPI